MNFKKFKNANSGITLITLVITIIVLLILAGVSIATLSGDNGILNRTNDAKAQTEIGEIKDNVQTDILAKQIDNQGGNIASAQLKSVLDKYFEDVPDDVNLDTELIAKDEYGKHKIKVSDIYNGAIEFRVIPGVIVTETQKDNYNDGINMATVPKGFTVSGIKSEQEIAKGLVIYDIPKGEKVKWDEDTNLDGIPDVQTKYNQFVWIPVTNFESTYTGGTGLSEPTELKGEEWASGKPKDSQEILNYYYGTKADGKTNYFDYATDFAYSEHYNEMVTSVNKYNGFYIGRYETTIDVFTTEDVGTKGNKMVLTEADSIVQTNNKVCNWYGLYYAQRNSNVKGNGDYIQTTMIWGQQWDAMITYFEKQHEDYSDWGATNGMYYSGNSQRNGKKDIISNIYDLRTNGTESTAEVRSNWHVFRGGGCYVSGAADRREGAIAQQIASSRMSLYIK